jgi:hypothetical protein
MQGFALFSSANSNRVVPIPHKKSPASRLFTIFFLLQIDWLRVRLTPVPRKPTKFARAARADLEKLAASLREGEPLPALVRLGEAFSIHPSTILRILRDLVQEGTYWQSPTGRFYSASSRREKLRCAPICFVGREVWHWSRLYQEILEGVSEIAEANGSPLVTLTSRTLVWQASPDKPPRFASRRTQARELAALLTATPKACAGYILDHLWMPGVIDSARWPGGQLVQLLCGSGKGTLIARVDAARGAALVADYARSLAARRVMLVVPFSGDPAINLSIRLLKKSLAEFDLEIRDFQAAADARDPAGFSLVVCPEDNIAHILAECFGKLGPPVIGTQGTGVLQAPNARLRYDFRRLGRASASTILSGKESEPFSPALIHGHETNP